MAKNVLHFSSNNSFDKEVLQASQTNPVMVDFFATWCGPCRKLSPILEEASSKYGFKLVVIDVEKNNSLANEFHVSSIPHILLFHKGSKVMEFVGLDTNKLQDMISYIKKNTNKFSGKGVNKLILETPIFFLTKALTCPIVFIHKNLLLKVSLLYLKLIS